MTFEQMIYQESGYECKTTFWTDFRIAEMFGESAIEETYDRVFREWHNNIVYLTELVLVLNHKIWYFYGKGNERMARLYDSLWRKTDDWARNHLESQEDAEYYFNTLD